MRGLPIGFCDKTQYEHNGLHERILECGQMWPPFACQNWREVTLNEKGEVKAQPALFDVSKPKTGYEE